MKGASSARLVSQAHDLVSLDARDSSPRRSPARRALVVFATCLALVSGCALPGPEDIVNRAIAAAADGDREAFAECFTARSRPVLEVWWSAVDAGRPERGALAAGDVRVTGIRRVQSRDFDPERAVVTVEEGSDAMRLVLHHVGGMWRIDLLDTERSGRGGGSAIER